VDQASALPLTAAGGQGSRVRAFATRAFTTRFVLICSIAIAWLNFLLTSRWAHVPGTLHGWRRPYYLAALSVLTVLALRGRAEGDRPGRLLPRLSLAAGIAVLVAGFFFWFPPQTWTQVPFADDWPPRYQSTVEIIALIRRGAMDGWQWAFLGGYHTASDITQNLGALGLLPMSAFGPAVGFHLLHAVLFMAIPSLVFLDLREEDREVALLAAGFSCFLVGIFSYTFMRSGDTNSIAGVACTALTIVASHMARRGRRAGPPLVAVGLVLTAYSHAGFLAYAVFYLALEAVYYRDVRSAITAGFGVAIALVASLPFTWDLWRYPAYFSSNNLGPGPPPPLEWAALLRKVYYNTELLVRPGRWTNDYTGVTLVFLPVVVFVAWQRRSRAAFHAVAALGTVLLLRFNVPQAGYLFHRPMHMLAFLAAAPLASFVIRHASGRALRTAVVVVVALFAQITFQHVPHVPDASRFDPPLVDHAAHLDGALILLENNPHRNMDATGGQTEPSAFEVHFESLLAAATKKRFYAGYWDGWQWCPWRDQTLAGGAFRGAPIERTSRAAFVSEMQRWGIAHLLVWSNGARRYLDAHPQFVRRWSYGRWVEYELLDADRRSVVVPRGSARLVGMEPLGARVELSDVRAGDLAVVRTNYFPAWTAASDGRSVPLVAANGQLAFAVPRSGTFAVTLRYPRRRWLSVLSLLVATIGIVALAFGGLRERGE
jgi:hypothetical protein